MNGLLYKDLLGNRYNILVMAVFATTLCAFIGRGGPMALLMGPAITATVVSNSIVLDEKSKWLRFAISSGVSRKDVIRSKLILNLLTTALGALCGIAGLAISSAIYEISVPLADLVLVIIAGCALGLATGCALTYVGYRFNSNYASVIMCAMIGSFCGIMSVSGDLAEATFDNGFIMFPLIGAAFAAIAVVFYMVAQRALVRKDL